MKKITFLSIVLTVALSACGAIAPTQAPVDEPVQPPATPHVVIATVLVTVIPTEGPPTALPSVTPLPPTVPPPTEAPAQAPAETPVQDAAPVSASTSGVINIDPSLNGGVFTNISLSGDKFTLNCSPKEISFDMTATNIYITRVDFYYRIRDKHSEYVPGWSLGGTLETDGGDHFWGTYTGDAVNADNRKDTGWFDVQFVGLNRYGDSVGRSDKIAGLVTYMTNCP